MLIATWEPSWCEAGLGDPCVHVRPDDAEAGAFLEAWFGPITDVPDGRGIVRLRPELDLATVGALLTRAGLRVDELVPGAALRASRGAQG